MDLQLVEYGIYLPYLHRTEIILSFIQVKVNIPHSQYRLIVLSFIAAWAKKNWKIYIYYDRPICRANDSGDHKIKLQSQSHTCTLYGVRTNIINISGV